MAASKRIQRLNQLIKREVAQLILREVEFPRDILVTVTRVETTHDLKESKAFISVFPKREEEVLKLLNQKLYFLQKKIDKRLKMRPVPKISFWKEKRTAEAGRIEEILERLKK